MDHTPELHDALKQQANGLAQRADDALSAVSDHVQDLRARTPKALSRAAEQVELLAERGLERAHELKDQARHQAEVVNDRTVSYIREEPVKAVLIAAAAGAALAALAGLWSRSSRS